MSDQDEKDKGKVLEAEFKKPVTYTFRMSRDPKDLARILDALYRTYQDIDDDEAYDTALRNFVEAMYLELGERRESKQLEGYISYCEWVLNERETPGNLPCDPGCAG